MTKQNEGKGNTSGVHQANPATSLGDKQHIDKGRAKAGATQDDNGEVLPPEEVGNVTSGLAETPDRPEPANGDPVPEDDGERGKQRP